VGHHDLLRQWKAQPCAAFFRGVEQIEHVFAVFVADSSAIIVHLDSDSTFVSRRLELGDAAVWHGLPRIAKKIEERLPELWLVHRDLGKLGP
jgi:hypothetical protein